MTIIPKLPPDQQMTVEEFLAFVGTRPDEERWELIEGVPTLSPSPVDYHQIVCSNLIFELMTLKRATSATWIPLIGTNARVPVSPNSLPLPDVMVKELGPTGSNVADDGIVLIEVLSPSNSRSDIDWRRKVYTSVANCRHYAVVSMSEPLVTAYHRDTGWQEQRLAGLAATLKLSAIGAALSLASIYRYTAFDPAAPRTGGAS